MAAPISVMVAFRLGHLERQHLLTIFRGQDQPRLEFMGFGRGYLAFKAMMIVGDGFEAKRLRPVGALDNHRGGQIIGMPIDGEAHPLTRSGADDFQCPSGQIARNLERRRRMMTVGMRRLRTLVRPGRAFQADIRFRQRRQVGEQFPP